MLLSSAASEPRRSKVRLFSGGNERRKTRLLSSAASEPRRSKSRRRKVRGSETKPSTIL